jgi:hypothetical protein
LRCEAERSWQPPLIRCTSVDQDPGQVGELAHFAAWGWWGLLFVAAVAGIAFVTGREFLAVVRGDLLPRRVRTSPRD